MENIEHSYATALYDIGLEEKLTEQYLLISKTIIELFANLTGLNEYLSSPNVSLEEKKELFADFNKIENKHYINLVFLLIEDKQIRKLTSIAKAFIELFNEDNNIVSGEVWSTYGLEPETIKKMEDKFETILKKKVHLKNFINKELIAGVKVNLDGKTWDKTIRSQIQELSKELKEGTNNE